MDFSSPWCSRSDVQVEKFPRVLPLSFGGSNFSCALSVVPVRLQLSLLGAREFCALRDSDPSVCAAGALSLDSERPTGNLGTRNYCSSACSSLSARIGEVDATPPPHRQISTAARFS